MTRSSLTPNPDAFDGGAGIDTASYFFSSVAVTVNLADASMNRGDAQGDTLTNIENLEGSAHNDALTGDGNANVLTGGAGNDVLIGGAGKDIFIFRAGGGTDTITDAAAGEELIFLGITSVTSIVGNVVTYGSGNTVTAQAGTSFDTGATFDDDGNGMMDDFIITVM